MLVGEEDTPHVSATLRVRRTAVRLCMTLGDGSRSTDGPYVLIGSDEYTLYEADGLIGALTQLVDAAADVGVWTGPGAGASGVTPRAEA